MERLTDRCWRNFDPWECCGQDYYCQRGCHDKGGCTNGCIVPKLYARLASYEDTNLTPKEIMGLCSMHERVKMAELLRQEENRPLAPEELHRMSGEPYWHVGLRDDSGPPHWVILPDNVAKCPQDYQYGKGWLAYRRKPEGSQ